jgi:hypothetical protein
MALAASFGLRADDITPRVGSIEVYGTRKVSVQKIKAAIGTREGQPPPSREDAEERIGKIPGVLTSRVEAACCSGSNVILYVGVQEKDAPHFEFHPAPNGKLSVPPSLAAHYDRFLNSVALSMREARPDEDLTNGYSLMADTETRTLQQSFIPAVAENLAFLDRILRESADPDQRSMAAYLMQYAPRDVRSAKVMVNALQYALQDQEDTVRETAMQALRAVAVGARLHKEQEIRIEPTWFVELMNSVVWSDRRNASLALVNLTEDRDPATLSLLKERALPAIVEMAKWRDLRHALPAFILAGRLAGLEEGDIKTAWVNGQRDLVLQQVLNPKKKFRLPPGQG